MATRFELILHGENEPSLRASGEAALEEIERLEKQLSPFLPGSEISHINARAASEPVPVSHPVFELLDYASRLTDLTQGAFDITVGPLMQLWGFAHGNPREPNPDLLQDRMSVTGSRHILLDRNARTVRFDRPGIRIDLGAIGKGYAIDEAIAILKESGVHSALLHGGTSTVYGLGTRPDGSNWTVSLEDPATSDRIEKSPDGLQRLVLRTAKGDATREATPSVIDSIELRDQSLSVSSPRGKFFEKDGHLYGHVLDPRTGRPALSAKLAAVRTVSATDSDALSTALLVLGPAAIGRMEAMRPNLTAWIR